MSDTWRGMSRLVNEKTRRGAGFFHRHERNADAARASQTPPEQTEFLGPNPVGYINYGADGRMLVLTVASGRRKPAGPKATSTEVEALFRSMTSYGGTYTIHGNEITQHVFRHVIGRKYRYFELG